MRPYTRITVADFVREVSLILTSALQNKHRVTLAVPGGSTPKLYLGMLSEIDLDWNRVDVFLTDERWVDSDSDYSNELSVRKLLLQKKAEHAIFHPVYREGIHISKAVDDYNTVFDLLGASFDLVILGMGNDSHIASVFPGDQLIFKVHQPYSVVDKEDASGNIRISITPWAIKRTKTVMLTISGDKKEDVLSSAWGSGNEISYPVSILKHRSGRQTLLYSLD